MTSTQVIQGISLHETNEILSQVERVHGAVEIHKIAISAPADQTLPVTPPEGRVEAFSVTMGRAHGYLYANPSTPLCLYDFYHEDLCQHLDIVSRITPVADRQKQEMDKTNRERVGIREKEILLDAKKALKVKGDADRAYGLFSDLNSLVGFTLYDLPDSPKAFIEIHGNKDTGEIPNIIMAMAHKAELLINDSHRYASYRGAMPVFPEAERASKTPNEIIDVIDILNKMHAELTHQQVEMVSGVNIVIAGNTVELLRNHNGVPLSLSKWTLTRETNDTPIIDATKDDNPEDSIPLDYLSINENTQVVEGGKTLRDARESAFFELVDSIVQTACFFPNESYPAFPFELKDKNRYDTGYMGDCSDFLRHLLSQKRDFAQERISAQKIAEEMIAQNRISQRHESLSL